jgi:acyl-CoA thioesterase-1
MKKTICVISVFLSLAGAVQAAVVIRFDGATANAATANANLTAAVGTIGAGASKTIKLGYSTSTPLLSSNGGTYTGQSVYGGFSGTYSNISGTSTGVNFVVLQYANGASVEDLRSADTFTSGQISRQVGLALLFGPATNGTYSLDAASSLTAKHGSTLTGTAEARWVVVNDGTTYLSSSGFNPGGSATTTLDNPDQISWAAWTPGTDMSFVSLTYNTPGSSLTNITLAGVAVNYTAAAAAGSGRYILQQFTADLSDGTVSPDPNLKKVLLLGDAVMQAYRPEVVRILEGTAACTFVNFPETGSPDWDAFCSTYVETGTWDVIHFSYGRELMFHTNGVPRAAASEVTGIYSGLVARLQGSAPALIGCTITPVYGTMPEYVSAVDADYAAKFKQVITNAGLRMNDLADYTQTRIEEMVQLNSNLPTALGVQLMGEVVANSILEALNAAEPAKPVQILVVGDSIVSGYYSALCGFFDGQASVSKGGTTYNDPNPRWAALVDSYIATGGSNGWDVIQFNWGLHAVKYVDENNVNCLPGDPGAHIQFTVEEYARQMELWVKELKRTGAKLVFATTTPVPEGAGGSIPYIDVTPYNDAAKAIMATNGIAVNDLYAFAFPRLTELQIANNVHFTAYGSSELARKTYSGISPMLKKDTGGFFFLLIGSNN